NWNVECIVYLFSSRRRHTRLVSDWSSDVCSSDLYRKKLEASFILPDMRDHKDIEDNVRKRREMLMLYPKLLCEAAFDHFHVDGRSEERRVGKECTARVSG